MRLIGLCGRSGSGKGVFSSIAAKNGIFVIDCDAVYKELVSKPTALLLELGKEFGNEIINNGALNRRILAPIVFNDKEKLSILNKISHKHIRAEIEKIITSLPEETVVLLDAPTLFESGIDEMCDLIIGIVASDEICVSRIVKRDNITEEEAKLRLANQYSLEFIIDNCDCIIYNDQTLCDFELSSLETVNNIKEGLL
jgi:dephospho-CoA kinase